MLAPVEVVAVGAREVDAFLPRALLPAPHLATQSSGGLCYPSTRRHGGACIVFSSDVTSILGAPRSPTSRPRAEPAQRRPQYAQGPRPGFNKATVNAWRVSLDERGLGSSSIIVRMSAIRKLAVEATDNGLLAPELAAGIQRMKSAKS